MSNILRIKKTAEQIKEMYDNDPRTDTFNMIVHGPIKTGKTSLLATCRKPVFVHSFDPGGTEVLKEYIAKGEVLVDTRFEVEDPYKPTACRQWEDSFNKLRKQEFFNHVGTFCIDSMTTWAQTVMYEVIRRAALKKKDRVVGGHPHREDWLPQMAFLENYMRIFTSLPCDCVLTGHSDQPTDEQGVPAGDKGIMVTGKLRERIPALFSEIYYLEIKDYKKETRQLLTQPAFRVQAGSRLGKGGKLEKYEEPDIKKILQKVGMSTQDKPLFKDLEETNE